MAEGDVTVDRIEINDSNAQAILKSADVAADLQRRGQAIAATAAGSGGKYYVDAVLWGARRAVFITTGDMEARRAEATDRALTRALDAGR